MLVKTMVATAIFVLCAAATPAVSQSTSPAPLARKLPPPITPDRRQMIENENLRMKAAKERADAAKAAQIEAAQKRAPRARGGEVKPPGSEDPI